MSDSAPQNAHGGPAATSATNGQPHNRNFYLAKANSRQEYLERGEDPYANFKRLVDERGRTSTIEKLYTKLMGKKKDATMKNPAVLEEQQLGKGKTVETAENAQRSPDEKKLEARVEERESEDEGEGGSSRAREKEMGGQKRSLFGKKN